MLYQLLDRLQGNIFLESERLNDLASLNQHVFLDQALVRVLGVPLLANRHAHEGVELL